MFGHLHFALVDTVLMMPVAGWLGGLLGGYVRRWFSPTEGGDR